MPQKIRVTADCDALRAPYESGERLYRIAAGSEFVLLRDDDRAYYKVACAGVPVYVPKALAVLEVGAIDSGQATVIPLHGSFEHILPQPAIKDVPRSRLWLRLAAAVVFGATVALVIASSAFSGCEAGDGECKGYEGAAEALVLIWGSSLAVLLLVVSFTTSRQLQWVLFALVSWLLVWAFFFDSIGAGGVVRALVILGCLAGLFPIASLFFGGPYSSTGLRARKR